MSRWKIVSMYGLSGVIDKGIGSTPVGGLENSFSDLFDLRTLLHYFHFIQVVIPLII